MARTVGSEKMVDALAESLKPRMAGNGGDALNQFQSILLKGLADVPDKDRRWMHTLAI